MEGLNKKMKTIKVIVDNHLIGIVPIYPNTTIRKVKEYAEFIMREYGKFEMYADPQYKLDLSRIDDDLVLGPYLNSYTDPILKIYSQEQTQKAGYRNLPADVKRYLIDMVEPIQALTLCETVPCNWDHLLNINYDFVTQGVAPGNTAKEKFEYLANRVSKNTNTNNQPEIIFLHFNGIPLGDKNLHHVNFEHRDVDEDDMEDEMREIIEDRNKFRDAFINTLSGHPSVEWIRNDDYNVWVKVIDKNKLPDTFSGPTTDQSHRAIYRDNDMYDYPEKRMKNVKKGSGRNYPGTANITHDVIRDMLKKVMAYEEDIEDIEDAVNGYAADLYVYDMVPEYTVYMMMGEELTRSEAEAFSKAFYMKGSFANNLRELYGFDVDTM